MLNQNTEAKCGTPNKKLVVKEVVVLGTSYIKKMANCLYNKYTPPQEEKYFLYKFIFFLSVCNNCTLYGEISLATTF